MHSSRRYIKGMISVFLAAVVLFSTTGFTLHKHICACKNEVVYTFFPEVFGLKKSCCCAEKDKTNEAIIQYRQLLANPDCCKNVFLFYKLPSLNVVVVNVLQKIDFLSLPVIHKVTSISFKAQISEDIAFLYRPPPLILNGQSLIQFIHCLKIPLPEIA
jgi:hypothetical protein